MREPLKLRIPQPCHEKWADMKPEEKGRFCLSCQKTVVDFSYMTDRQVLEYFSSYTGSACGRFSNDQLNRPITAGVQKPDKWYKYLLGLFVPAMLIGSRNVTQGEAVNPVSVADTTKPAGKDDTLKLSPPLEDWVMGDVISTVIDLPGIVRGKVINEMGEPLEGATVQVMGTTNMTTTDSSGNFGLISVREDSAVLYVTYVGMEPKEVSVGIRSIEKYPLVVVMDAYPLPAYVGMFISVEKLEIEEPVFHKFNRFIADSLGIKKSLVLYPNTARPGSLVNMTYPLEKGRYFIRLINVNGQTMQQDAVNVETKTSTASFRLHNMVNPGQYVVIITNNNGKRVTSGQLIVQ